MTRTGKINSAQLNTLASIKGNLHHVSQKEPGGNLMEGEFILSQQYSGIWVHACRIRELQDAICSFERPPGLSFTFLFEGEVEFAIGNHDHRFRSPFPGKLCCSAISLNRTELMVRRIRKNSTIHKLNLSIEKSWLESRCHLPRDGFDLNLLFSKHKGLYEWEVPLGITVLIEKLMSIINQDGLLNRLQIESLSNEILHHCLGRLKEICRKDNYRDCTKIGSVRDRDVKDLSADKLRQKIDQLLPEYQNLNDLADELNMSVSTLQRRFKQYYSCTVTDYIRRKRLALARIRILEEELSIDEAAFLAGYRYTSNFVTAFKKTYGTTPNNLKRKVTF